MDKVAFITLGCRLNQAEEEKLRRDFSEIGFFVSDVPEADLVVINTCSVTQLADKKSRQKIRSIINKNQKAKTVVMGCGVDEARNLDGIDLYISNSEKTNAFKIITQNFGIGGTALNHIRAVPSDVGEGAKRTRALLKVQDGCNNFCTYCIVPYLRGREVSLPVSEVIAEAKKLNELGYQELVISGVNVGKYNYKKQTINNKSQKNLKSQNNKYETINLTKLIKLVLKETLFPRIRLSSINPQDISAEMVELWGHQERLCDHFHLSLQSGSTSVLKRMKRPYSAQEYADVVALIRKKIPNIAITTDIIVGFPGETEVEFKESCNFVKLIGFSKIHVFPYSIRRGTKAAEMTDQVDKKIIKNRAEILRKIGDELRTKYLDQFIGRNLDVLFEKIEDQKGPTLTRVGPLSKTMKEEVWYGLTSNYIRVKHKSNEDLANKILKINLSEDNIIY